MTTTNLTSNEREQCGVFNPGGSPCTKHKGHNGGHDPAAYGPTGDEREERLEQATKVVADDLPYRIIDEMGLGLTFRSCTCGQLPCARLRPLREALEAVGQDAATRMRDKCLEKADVVERDAAEKLGLVPGNMAFENGRLKAAREIREAIQSLTLDQVEQETK